MREIDFYSLPRVEQDRLIDCLRGSGTPLPLAARLGPRRRPLIGLVASGLALVLWLILVWLGLGETSSALALHPPWLGLLHVGLALVLFGGGLHVLAWRARTSALPFAPGVYLFPAMLLDAREPKVSVWPLTDLTSVAVAPPGGLSLSFGSKRFLLPVAKAAEAEGVLQHVEGLRQRLAGPLTATERFELDPLEPPTMPSPLSPTVQRVRIPPIWERRYLVVALFLAVLSGSVVLTLRNRSSDDRLLAYAEAKNDVEAFENYLARGERHRQQIARVALPRARLEHAKALGTVAAIDAFMKEHADHDIAAEVLHARRVALVKEFEQARSKRTFDALLGYARQHPDHGIGKPWDDARANLYRTALAQVVSRLPADADSARAFVERLVSYSQKAGTREVRGGYEGPQVKIRFAREPSTTLPRADGAIRRNPMFNGSTSYVTRYFDAARLDQEEARMAKALSEELSRSFPKEIVTFAPGAALDPDQADDPKPTEPTLLIRYRVEWSGGAFASRNPRAVLVGVLVFFRAAFFIPGDSEPLTRKFTAGENVPRSAVEAHAGSAADGSLESAVYGAMTRSAFDQFQTRYLAGWVAEPADAKR